MTAIGPFSLQVSVVGKMVTLATQGPLNEDAGPQIMDAVEKLITQGLTRYVFDLGHVLTISSPTVAVFLDLVERIVDEKGGRVVFCGLTELNLKVFEMVGIFLYGESAPTRQEAEVQVLL
jgi:anti-anti-sigma factor